MESVLTPTASFVLNSWMMVAINGREKTMRLIDADTDYWMPLPNPPEVTP